MKAAREPDFRVCPNCGARNKARWEYCVRCSESLSGVPLGDAAVADAATVAKGAPAPVEDYDEGLPWGSIFGTLILVGIGIGIYRVARQPDPPPSPQIFTVGTLPTALPSPTAAGEKPPGQEEYEAGLKLLNTNDPAGAAALFARAAGLASENDVYRHAYAVALWQSGAKMESIDQYQQALRLSPANPTYRLNLAKALASVGRTAEAVAEYEVLNARSPNTDALQEMARLLADTDPERARDLLRRAAGTRPGDAVLKQQLASVLEKTGDTQGASQMYSEILESNPGAHVTRGLLAEIYLKGGQQDQALALFRAGLQQYPDAPLLHRGLASALERSGAVAEAISAYREYARLAPNAPDAQQLRDRADRLEKRVASATS